MQATDDLTWRREAIKRMRAREKIRPIRADDDSQLAILEAINLLIQRLDRESLEALAFGMANYYRNTGGRL